GGEGRSVREALLLGDPLVRRAVRGVGHPRGGRYLSPPGPTAELEEARAGGPGRDPHPRSRGREGALGGGAGRGGAGPGGGRAPEGPGPGGGPPEGRAPRD